MSSGVRMTTLLPQRYEAIKPLGLLELISTLHLQDVQWLLARLGNLKGSTEIQGYAHGDFLWVSFFMS